ncbi:hypothetical protein MAR_032964, partial [Mya arenaria]
MTSQQDRAAAEISYRLKFKIKTRVGYSVVITEANDFINKETLRAAIAKTANGKYVKGRDGGVFTEYLDYDNDYDELFKTPVYKYMTPRTVYQPMSDDEKKAIDTLKKYLNKHPSVLSWHDGDEDTKCEFNGKHLHIAVFPVTNEGQIGKNTMFKNAKTHIHFMGGTEFMGANNETLLTTMESIKNLGLNPTKDTPNEKKKKLKSPKSKIFEDRKSVIADMTETLVEFMVPFNTIDRHKLFDKLISQEDQTEANTMLQILRNPQSASMIRTAQQEHAHNVISSFVSDSITPALTRYHCRIVCVLKFTILKTSNYKRHIWLYDKSNYGEFQNKLQATNWETILNSNNIDQTASSISDTIILAVLQTITNKIVTIRPNDIPWIYNTMRKQIKIRKKIHKLAKRQHPETAWSNFRNSRNKVIYIRKPNEEHENKLIIQVNNIVISPQYVLEAITSFDPSKACGPDLVSPRLIGEGATFLATPLSIYFKSVQNEALRIVSGATKYCNINSMFAEHKWESLADRCRKHKLITFYKIYHSLSPKYLTDIIPAQEQTRYNLRTTNNTPTIIVRTQLYQNYFLPATICEWNKLPYNIRNLPRTLPIFRHLPNRLIVSIGRESEHFLATRPAYSPMAPADTHIRLYAGREDTAVTSGQLSGSIQPLQGNPRLVSTENHSRTPQSDNTPD